MPLGLQSHSTVRKRTGSQSSRGTDSLEDEEFSEEDRPVATKVFATGDYLRALRRALSQPAKPAGESSVQIRLASLARNFRGRMHESSGFGTSLLSLTAVRANSLNQWSAPRAQWPLSMPVFLEDSRRGRQTAHALGAQTVSTTWSQTSGSGIWIRLEIIAPERYLSQRFNFGHGSFSESLSSLTPRLILAVPSAEVPLIKSD